MPDTAGATGLIPGEHATAAVENAAERQFGPEFQDIHILSNAQVAVILQASARSAVNRDEELNEVYRKTQKYVERFNTMANAEKDHQELVEELEIKSIIPKFSALSFSAKSLFIVFNLPSGFNFFKFFLKASTLSLVMCGSCYS